MAKKKYRPILGFVHTMLDSLIAGAIKPHFHAKSGFFLESEYSSFAFCSTKGSSISFDFSSLLVSVLLQRCFLNQ